MLKVNSCDLEDALKVLMELVDCHSYPLVKHQELHLVLSLSNGFCLERCLDHGNDLISSILKTNYCYLVIVALH